jgi:hypothetical protein
MSRAGSCPGASALTIFSRLYAGARGKYCGDRKSKGMVIGGFHAPVPPDMRSTIEKPRRGLVVEEDAGGYRNQ